MRQLNDTRDIEKLKQLIINLERELVQEREENKRKDEVIIDLQARQELSDILARMAGGLPDELLRMSKRMHRAERDVQRLERSISDFPQQAESYYAKTRTQLEENFELFTLANEQSELPPLSASILHIASASLQLTQDMFETTRQNALQKLGLTDASEDELLDAYNHPGFSLAKAWEILILAAKLEVSDHMVMQALGWSNSPPLIVEHILRQCRSSQGSPSLKLLNRLPDGWISANLPDPPEATWKLAEGLTWAQRQKNSRKAIKVFAELEGISDKTLRRYVGWYDSLVEFQERAKLTDFLPPEALDFIVR